MKDGNDCLPCAVGEVLSEAKRRGHFAKSDPLAPPGHSPYGIGGAQTVAWYKQFWPWFLIVLPGAVVIASMITMNIAFKYADQPVVGDYEKHGLTVLHKSSVDKPSTEHIDTAQ